MKKQTEPKKVFEEYCPKEDRKTTYVPTGIMPIDLLTMGKGLPLGRLIHIWSLAGFGKTTIIYSVVKNLILAGEKVLWIGIEPSKQLAEAMGLIVNGRCIDGFRYLEKVSFYDELQAVTDAWLECNEIRWMVIDSLTAVSPPLEMMKEDVLDVSIGLDARIEAKYLRLYHALVKRKDKSIIFITQSRMQINIRPGGVTKENAAGGKATEFYSDLRIKMIGNFDVDSSTVEQREGSYIIGKCGYLMAEKNRHAIPFVKIPVTILFGKGVSNLQTLFEYTRWRGLVSGQGWYSCSLDGVKIEKVQGQVKVKEWIEANIDFVKDDFYKNTEKYFEFLALSNGKKAKVDF